MPATKTKVQTQDERIAALEQILLHKPRWVRIQVASQELGISCSTLRRRCNSPQFPRGKCWKWNYNQAERFFDVAAWREAEENW